MVLVLTALSFEAAAWRGIPGRGEAWCVAVTGMGPERARRAAAAWLEKIRPHLVIGAGVCGGLLPGDRAGCVVMPDEFAADAPGQPVLRRTWQPKALDDWRGGTLPVVTSGRMVSVERPARTPEEKTALAVRHRARWVDQETYAWCQAALEAGIPFFCLRVVLDAAEEYLPDWRNGRSWRSAVRLPARALAARRALAEAGRRLLCAHL
ncbi:phosphorylase family protein [Alicyclobacillus cellulosilyticus]|nr:phosphorylase [Alicyclobacillus cellulosilyticus]